MSLLKLKYLVGEHVRTYFQPMKILLVEELQRMTTVYFVRKATEFVLHVLWECSVAQDVWTGCSIGRD